MTRTAIVGHFGIFVKVLAHAVTDILLHHAEPELLHIALHRPADIADPVARNSGGNTAAQPLLGGVQQLLDIGGDAAYCKGKGVIAMIPFVTGTYING